MSNIDGYVSNLEHMRLFILPLTPAHQLYVNLRRVLGPASSVISKHATRRPCPRLPAQGSDKRIRTGVQALSAQELAERRTHEVLAGRQARPPPLKPP